MASNDFDGLRPEITVLTAVARRDLRAQDMAAIGAAFAAGIDGRRLVALARAHRLVPLLHTHTAAGAVPLDTGVARELGRLAAVNASRMLQRASELVAIVTECAAAGLTVVPLKGPVLAQQVYGSVGMRQAGDLDVLCRECEQPVVLDLLRRRGYVLERRATPAADEIALRDLHHVTAVHAHSGIRLELHHLLLRPRGRRRYGLDVLAPFLRTITFMGAPVSALDDTALLAYLCEHGAEHTWTRLEWMATVAELFRRQADAPAQDRSLAVVLGVERRMDAARLLAQAVLNEPPAEEVVPRRRLLRANAIVARRLLTTPERVIETPGERLQYLLLTDSRLVASLRRVTTMVAAPSIADREAAPLPHWLQPLHWALRPLRLLRRELTRD